MIVPENISVLFASAYKYAVMATNNMKFIHWNAVGKFFDRVHDMANEYYSKLADDTDFIAELCLQNNIDIVNPCLAAEDDTLKALVISDRNIDYYKAIDLMLATISAYVSAVDALSSEVGSISRPQQNELDTIIYFWQKELEYKLNRRIIKTQDEAFDVPLAPSTETTVPDTEGIIEASLEVPYELPEEIPEDTEEDSDIVLDDDYDPEEDL